MLVYQRYIEWGTRRSRRHDHRRPPPPRDRARAASRAAHLAVDIYAGIMEGRDIAYRYERLSRLSNAELARLGLTRQDIPRAAVNGIAGF